MKVHLAERADKKVANDNLADYHLGELRQLAKGRHDANPRRRPRVRREAHVVLHGQLGRLRVRVREGDGRHHFVGYGDARTR